MGSQRVRHDWVTFTFTFIDVGKDWGQEEKGSTEDEMVGSHHWLNGHTFKQTQGDSEGQGSLACCSPWGHKELDMIEWLSNNIWLVLCLVLVSINISVYKLYIIQDISLNLVLFGHSVMSDYLQTHWQYTMLPCTSRSPGIYSNSCPLSRWCHPTISSFVIPFSYFLNFSLHQDLIIYYIITYIHVKKYFVYSGLVLKVCPICW